MKTIALMDLRDLACIPMLKSYFKEQGIGGKDIFQGLVALGITTRTTTCVPVALEAIKQASKHKGGYVLI